MKLVTYDEVLEKTVIIDLQARFCDELEQLRTLGFQEDYYLRETSPPFSAIVLLPFLIYAHLKGKCVRIGGRLQAMSFNPCMIHEDGYACAVVTNLGVRYLSVFDDGTLLVTATYKNGSLQLAPSAKLKPTLQYVPSGKIKRTWKHHVKSVKDLTRKGHSVIKPIWMEDVMRMEERYNYFIMGIMPDDLKEKQKNEG